MTNRDLSNTSQNLYARAASTNGTEEIVLENGYDDYDADAVSAAFALRSSGLPYTPIKDSDAPPNAPRATVEFKVDLDGPELRQVKQIPAQLLFVSETGRPPVDFLAHLVLHGDQEFHNMKVRYTQDLRITQDDLASLMDDVYQKGSVNENSFQDWDEMKAAVREFEGRMLHIAATIVQGPDHGFSTALWDHMARFDPFAAGYPDNSVEVTLEDRHGKLTATFEPTSINR